jgi:hypothetical protein
MMTDNIEWAMREEENDRLTSQDQRSPITATYADRRKMPADNIAMMSARGMVEEDVGRPGPDRCTKVKQPRG